MARIQRFSNTLLLTVTVIILSFSQQQLALKHSPRFLGKFASSSSSPQLDINYETRYFQQNLDHFSFRNLPTFQQRYLINTEHWIGPQRSGPIFVYCGNEGDIVWFAQNTGFVWEIAPQFGAMVVFPEHRYYGESMPYGSREEAYKNATRLAHLTADQALADFAVLITDLKRNFSANASPVVLFGGSYGGMLAAWMRLKYPHIAIGALASSAPILQFEDIVPPETFYDIVSNDFKVQIGTHSFTFDHVYGSTGSPSCDMFEECVAPLVDGLFQGYNATVLAYGQTGSGKTYTMGTGFKEGFQTGIVPQVMNVLFNKIGTLKHQIEFQLHVSFIEILKEEVRDLLDPSSMSKPETANGHAAKITSPGKPPIQIRETSNGVITLAGSI